MNLDRVIVIGGGRWARVLTGSLCGLLPPRVRLSVHSPRQADAMTAWAQEHNWTSRVAVSSEWPAIAESESCAAVVVNATLDHCRAAETLLRTGVPVLVEKPIALSAQEAERLVAVGIDRGVPLGAAHVLRFARYLDRYAERVRQAGELRAVTIMWADPMNEIRYGEIKRYDPAMPMFTDLLPHIGSILGALGLSLPDRASHVAGAHPGSRLILDVVASHVPCRVELRRGDGQRRRVVEAECANGVVRLDFSREPGTITSGGGSVVAGDSDWSRAPSPASCMLSAFLCWAAGGSRDPRLDILPGVQACRLSDHIRSGLTGSGNRGHVRVAT